MLASLIVEETEVISFDTQIRVVRLSAPGLVGESLVEADVRARTGSTIIAVERDGNVLTDFDPSFVVADGDEVIVVGSDDAVDRFRAELA
jgi:K+/H+ antiporter YhaU regulatory subunit KhtT